MTFPTTRGTDLAYLGALGLWYLKGVSLNLVNGRILMTCSVMEVEVWVVARRVLLT
jgi:hypothetical protein